jgi:hypothetical protein
MAAAAVVRYFDALEVVVVVVVAVVWVDHVALSMRFLSQLNGKAAIGVTTTVSSR